MDDLSGRVIVGYDGSSAADAAVDWAAAEASRRRAPLTVLYVVEGRGVIPGLAPAAPHPIEDAAAEVSARGVERARKTASGIEVTGETHTGRPSAFLVEVSNDAALLVLGATGHGEVTAALLGSVAFTVTAHAACPVVVVGRDAASPGPDRPVVVGVDAWPQAGPVVDFAAEVAAGSGAPLVVTAAYRGGLVGLAVPERTWRVEYAGQPRFEELGRENALTAASDARLHVLGAHPGVEVRTEVEEGAPARLLSGYAQGAGLVVVGDRGTGGFAGLRLGSVSHALLHHSPCPVAVVRLPRSEVG